MKTFLEEYGLILLAILVVGALIAFAVKFNKDSTANANKKVTEFNNQVDKAVTDSNKNNESGGTADKSSTN